MQLSAIPHPQNGATPVLPPRARGQAEVSVADYGGTTRIAGLRQQGSMKLLFPRSYDRVTAVALNTSGGVTGGDNFDLSATAQVGTQLTVTTQAAERAYAAMAGEIGQIRNRLRVENGAQLHWVPQETILFDNAAIDRRLTAEIEGDGELLIVEPLIFGRVAMGETVKTLNFRDRIDITRDGQLIYADRARIDDAALTRAAGLSTLSGQLAAVNVVFAAPRAESLLPTVRDLLPSTGGASLIRDDLLVARILAPLGYDLRSALVPILETITGTALPRPWMI